MIPYRELNTPHLAKPYELGLPYSEQCARAIIRAIPVDEPNGRRLRRVLLDDCQEGNVLDLMRITTALDSWPRLAMVLVAGSDSSNPGYPQTLQNLRKWQERSALGRIYLDVLPLFALSPKIPCCFVRAKGTRSHKNGKYKGYNARANYVMHELGAVRNPLREEVACKVDFPGRRPVVVERRRTFIGFLVSYLTREIFL